MEQDTALQWQHELSRVIVVRCTSSINATVRQQQPVRLQGHDIVACVFRTVPSVDRGAQSSRTQIISSQDRAVKGSPPHVKDRRLMSHVFNTSNLRSRTAPPAAVSFPRGNLELPPL